MKNICLQLVVFVTIKEKGKGGKVSYSTDDVCDAFNQYLEAEQYESEDYIETEEYPIGLKDDCITQMGDILIRLSAPYTAVLIDQPDLCGIVEYGSVRLQNDILQR